MERKASSKPSSQGSSKGKSKAQKSSSERGTATASKKEPRRPRTESPLR